MFYIFVVRKQNCKLYSFVGAFFFLHCVQQHFIHSETHVCNLESTQFRFNVWCFQFLSLLDMTNVNKFEFWLRKTYSWGNCNGCLLANTCRTIYCTVCHCSTHVHFSIEIKNGRKGGGQCSHHKFCITTIFAINTATGNVQKLA